MTDPTHPLDARLIASLLADTTPYLSCDDCFDRMDEYVERRLADPQHDDAVMAAHLAGCAACAEEAEALLELVGDEADRPAAAPGESGC